jgi:hypothetical protein
MTCRRRIAIRGNGLFVKKKTEALRDDFVGSPCLECHAREFGRPFLKLCT